MNKKSHYVPGTSFPFMTALVGFSEAIQRKIKEFPYEKNVFLMMRFRKDNRRLSDFIIKTLSEAGFRGVRADQTEWNLTDDVYNPIAVLYCCKFGIALFDKIEDNQAYNPNVIYELGIMHTLGRECLILLSDSLPPVPFDLIKNLHARYKGELAVKNNIHVWLGRISTGLIKPERVTASMRKSGLEFAAVSAPSNETNSVVALPEDIASSGFVWRIRSKDAKSWKIEWAIKLTNKGKKDATSNVHVLFLDKNGFALDDFAGSPRVLPPNKTRLVKVTSSTSPVLARRIRRAVASVLPA